MSYLRATLSRFHQGVLVHRVCKSPLPAVLVAVFFLPSIAQVQSSLSLELRQKIDHVATDVLAATGVPSASVAIVKDGQISYLQSYGEARLDQPRQVSQREECSREKIRMRQRIRSNPRIDHFACSVGARATPDPEPAGRQGAHSVRAAGGRLGRWRTVQQGNRARAGRHSSHRGGSSLARLREARHQLAGAAGGHVVGAGVH